MTDSTRYRRTLARRARVFAPAVVLGLLALRLAHARPAERDDQVLGVESTATLQAAPPQADATSDPPQSLGSGAPVALGSRANSPAEKGSVGREAGGWGRIVGLVASAAVVLALVAWGVAVAVSLERRKHYRDNTLDEGFSADERLRGELTTLHVALLRAGVASYYEKVFEMLRRILKIRRLILDDDTTTGAILERLRSAEVDPTFLDCVESVANRCDAVLTGGAHPDEAAHGKIARDLKMLFTMRPNLAGRPRGRKSGDSDEA